MAEVVALGYTDWILVELDGAPVELDRERTPTLRLDLEESHVSGFTGVNRLTGTFALDAVELRFGPLATTLMAGPEDAMTLERRFLDALARVTSYRLEARALTLLAGETTVIRLMC